MKTASAAAGLLPRALPASCPSRAPLALLAVAGKAECFRHDVSVGYGHHFHLGRVGRRPTRISQTFCNGCDEDLEPTFAGVAADARQARSGSSGSRIPPSSFAGGDRRPRISRRRRPLTSQTTAATFIRATGRRSPTGFVPDGHQLHARRQPGERHLRVQAVLTTVKIANLVVNAGDRKRPG